MMEEFQTLQDIKRKRAQPKSMIQLYADFTWDEHVAYEAKMPVKCKEEAKERDKACQDGTEKIIRYGDLNMKIRKSNPKAHKSFRARHKCSTAKSKLTARYWSCRNW